MAPTMRAKRLLLAAAAAAAGGARAARAVTIGDEQFRPEPGYVYALCDGAGETDPSTGEGDPSGATAPPSIDVVDPATRAVIASLPVEPGTRWADGVYMEHCEVDGMPADQLLFAADRGLNQAYVVNATALNQNNTEDALLATVPIGEGPVHSYALPALGGGEFWVHADDSGHFDVISLNNISELRAGGPVVAHVDVPGHGKLLVDAAMPGYPFRGFASNTKEPAVYELLLPSGFGDAVSDIENVYNFSAFAEPFADLHCPSTHGLAYSKLNGHVYATCSDVGVMELDIASKVPVRMHRDAPGNQLFTTPDENYVVVVDKSGDSVHVIVPGEPGAASSKTLPSVHAQGGNPDKVAFFEMDDGSWRMYVSLTDNFHTLPDDTLEGDSGVGWVDLDVVYANQNEAQNLTKVPGAGAVTRKGPYTYRSITTTGSRVATITHHPVDGVALINGHTAELEGVAPTNQVCHTTAR